VTHHEEALRLYRQVGYPRGEGTALFNLALALDILGNRDQAIADAKSALRLRERINDPRVDEILKQLADWGKPCDTQT